MGREWAVESAGRGAELLLDEVMALKNAKETPFWAQRPHISSGYRSLPIIGESRVRWGIKSLFQLHNETVNVYTHLLPAIFLITITPQLLSGMSTQPQPQN